MDVKVSSEEVDGYFQVTAKGVVKDGKELSSCLEDCYSEIEKHKAGKVFVDLLDLQIPLFFTDILESAKFVIQNLSAVKYTRVAFMVDPFYEKVAKAFVLFVKNNGYPIRGFSAKEDAYVWLDQVED